MKVYVNSFIPEIEKITGVALLNKNFDASRIEFDGTETKINIRANEAFIEDQIELLKKYVERSQTIET